MRTTRVAGWMVSLLSAVSLGATSRDVPLVEAVKDANIAVVRALLTQGADVNVPQADGATALHWAAYQDDVDTADLLIRAGARVNAANELRVTPLWVASPNGSAALIATLLKAGADPNLAPPTGGAPLMRAARMGNTEAVRLLLNHGAAVNVREDARGQTALMWAVTQRHPNVVQMLIDGGADLEARSTVWRQFVLTCCQANNGDGTGSVWIDRGGFTPLLFAARLGDLDSVRLLLAAGANVNVAAPDGTTALVVAAHSGHAALATVLLDNGADPNAAGSGYTALHAAVLRDDLTLAKALLAHGANPNARLMNGTPARRGSRDYAFDKRWVGATPFWMAAGFHRPTLMQVLAASGADSVSPTKDGTMPLMAAAQGESPRALFQNGDPVLPPGEEGPTLQTIKMLVDLGANVNATNEAGDTALHRAASKGFTTVIQVLADAGAILDAQDKQGRTPLACARDHCHLLTDTKGAFVVAAFERVKDRGDKSAVALLRQLGARE